MKKKSITWLLFSLLITLCLEGKAQKKVPIFNSEQLEFSWKVTDNAFEGKRQYVSVFTLKNTGKQALPKSGWSLYFNYIRDINPNSISSNITIEHVNGDIFKLSPKTNFAGLEAGKTLDISFLSSEIFVNVADAPFGLYWVNEQKPEEGKTIQKYKVIPPTEDKVGYLTSAQLYEKNALIHQVNTSDLPPIFPTPQFYQKTSGNFEVNTTTTIVAPSEWKTEINYFQEDLQKVLGKKLLETSQASASSIVFTKQADLAEEAYHLTVTPTQINISTSTRKGAFYAIQSLKDLFPVAAWKNSVEKIQIPCLKVEDAPRFGFRSLMLDVARNFQKPAELKRVLDLMSTYKLNVLHLHFIDDEGWRLEINGLPELTTVGANRGHSLDSKNFLPASFGAGPNAGQSSGSGFYSRAEFIDILKYATDRHIQIIPEVESPGHARASIKAMDARYEKYKAQGNMEEAEKYWLRDPEDKSQYRTAQLWTDNVICVARPSVYTFLEKVTDEIITMYKDADAPLTTIHFGGDEVPAGVWEQSPLCQALVKADPTVNNIDDLWYYYFGKINTFLKKKGLFLSGWEEIAMRKTQLMGQKTMIPNPRLANEGFQVNVWNNMIGWGNEDLPYRLANAGYKVILSCVSNMYFDLSYQKTYEEPGYYWGGFVDVDKPFYFIPFDYFKNSTEDRRGNPIEQSYFVGKDRLTDFGKSNIVGIQGLLWSENVKSPERLEYMLLPKMLGLVERAWAPDPQWAQTADNQLSKKQYQEAWNVFVNTISQKELPKIESLSGGYQFRIPTAGAKVGNGKVYANTQMPSFEIRYTVDGSEPTAQSKLYTEPISEKGTIKLKVFSPNGRGGRSIEIKN